MQEGAIQGILVHMHYLLVLGRQPELSAAELAAIAPRFDAVLGATQEQTAIVDVAEPETLFRQLGGAVKIAKIVGRSQTPAVGDDILHDMLSTIPNSGKVVFGCSVYNDPSSAQRIADTITKRIKAMLGDAGRSARFVRGEGGILSSVLVSKQRLMQKGLEVILAKQGGEWVIATTLAVQDFEEFSRHDWGRPGRDSHSGMLPPKLARMMINLSGGNPPDVLLDPFCGSGTVLTEALRMGYGRVIGSDASEIAVDDARKNIEWLGKQQHFVGTAEVQLLDVRDLAKAFPKASIDCIVTEPYLGPPVKSGEGSRHDAAMLQKLYADAFAAFHALLRRQGRIVFIFPVLLNVKPPVFIGNLNSVSRHGFRMLPALPAILLKQFEQRLTHRQTILYKRPEQRVGREIAVFEKM